MPPEYMCCLHTIILWNTYANMEKELEKASKNNYPGIKHHYIMFFQDLEERLEQFIQFTEIKPINYA